MNQINQEKVMRMIHSGMSHREIARKIGCHPSRIGQIALKHRQDTKTEPVARLSFWTPWPSKCNPGAAAIPGKPTRSGKVGS